MTRGDGVPRFPDLRVAPAEKEPNNIMETSHMTPPPSAQFSEIAENMIPDPQGFFVVSPLLALLARLSCFPRRRLSLVA